MLTQKEAIVFPSVERIEEAFFEAMRHGYASGVISPAVRETRTDIAGMKRVVFDSYNPRGDLRVIDQWTETPGSRWSSGFTLITYQNIPVWIMHYGGWYNPEVTQFLKECLLDNYTKGLFDGGRGPNGYRKGRMVYGNESDNTTDYSFREFSGNEMIKDTRGDITDGHHWYHGHLLIPQ
jgi:hypothetical protein